MITGVETKPENFYEIINTGDCGGNEIFPNITSLIIYGTK